MSGFTMHSCKLDVPNDVDIDRQTTSCTDVVCGQEFERVWEDDGNWSVWYFLGSRTRYLAGRPATPVPA